MPLRPFQTTYISTLCGTATGNSNQWNSNWTTTNTNSGRWGSVYNNVNSNSANYILDGGNTKSANISIGTNDLYSLNLKANNNNYVVIEQFGSEGRFATSTKANVIGGGTATPVQQGGSGSPYGYAISLGAGTANGYNSLVFSNGTASGQYSVAGMVGQATGNYSLAIGTNTIATGDYSFAIGRNAKSRGIHSLALGTNVEAPFDRSFVWNSDPINEYVPVPAVSSTRIGQFMVSAVGGIYFPGNVGIGTDNKDNALTVTGLISTLDYKTSKQWSDVYTNVNSNSANYILDGGNTKNANILIGTNDAFNLNLETNNVNRISILSSGEVTLNPVTVTPALSSIQNLLNVRGTAVVYSDISSLTGLSALSGSSPGQFSAGGMLIGQNEGGAYLGRVSVRENSWQVLSGTEGANWTARESNRQWWGIAMSSDGRIQTAVHYGGQIYTSYDYGVTWTPRGSNLDWQGIAMSSDGRVQTAICVDTSQTFTSYDYGVTWTGSFSDNDQLGIAMSSDGRIQTMVAYNSPIFTSYDYGVTWTPRGSNLNGGYGVAMSSDGRVQTAVEGGPGTQGRIYTSYDYGVTWTARESSRNWRGIAMSSDGRIQTAITDGFDGNVGRIYTSYDYGVTWIARESNREWFAIAMSSDGRIQTAVVNNGGQIYISWDYGVTWAARGSSLSWRGIAMSSDGRIQTAFVNNGQIYTSYATTITPNSITVLGTISATSVIYASNGNSNQWNSVYTNVNSNSASWEESADILPTVTNYLSTNNVLLSSCTITDSLSVGGTIYSRLTANALVSFTTVVGNGINNTFTVNHGLNTPLITVSVFDKVTNVQSYPTITKIDNNSLTVQFSFIPLANAYEVNIQGSSPSNRIVAYGAAPDIRYKFVSTSFSLNVPTSYYYAVDTSLGVVRITLPASPALGDSFEFIDPYGTWQNNNLVLQRNGNNIQSLNEDLSADLASNVFKITYVGSSTGWRVY